MMHNPSSPFALDVYSRYQGKSPHTWVHSVLWLGSVTFQVVEPEDVPKMPNPSLPKIWLQPLWEGE